jgi:hypothetical protein
MIRGVTALLCALFLSSMLVVSLDNGQQQISPQIKIETGKNMGHQNGGYHIATNEWWTPSRPFQVSQNDSDGDGVVNSTIA